MAGKTWKLHALAATALAFVALGPGTVMARIELPLLLQQYKFDIDPKTPLAELLPLAPPQSPPEFLQAADLSLVPLVDFQKPWTGGKLTNEERAAATDVAKIQLAHQMAKINFANKQKTDRFVELLMAHRADLAGLPFSMGDACRQQGNERKTFKSTVANVRNFLAPGKTNGGGVQHHAEQFWRNHTYHRTQADGTNLNKTAEVATIGQRSEIAGLMQILGPEPAEYHVGLVQRLAEFEKKDRTEQEATLALAKLAVFSPDEGTRLNARTALQKRDAGPADAVLLRGLRYPWPSVAQNAAEAVVQLKRTDLVPELVKMLEESDPRRPVVRERAGKKVAEVRELVRINHHRNCLLCHPPGNTQDLITTEEMSKEVVVDPKNNGRTVHIRIKSFSPDAEIGAMPLPTEPFPTGPNPYGSPGNPDMFVRADVTYLRQDFSMFQKVANSHPWPEMQRFDFLVRSRVVTEKEAAMVDAAFAGQEANSPYRQAALATLRRLTGRDAGSTAQEWRTALGIQ